MSKNKPSTSMTNVACESNIRSVTRSSMHPYPGNLVAIGESKRETAIGSANRMFKLGKDKVKETPYYDHVGIKVCLKGDFHVRTEEKVKKARTALNMATCIGIRRKGLNMRTCCIIFWTIVIPTLCFGCELWILNGKDIAILKDFQRYAAKRIQRLHPKSLNITCCMSLGWIDIIRLILVKKVMFVRTILVMDDYIPIRRVFISKLESLPGEEIIPNAHDSPCIDLLNACTTFGLVREVKRIAAGDFMSKSRWKNIVWNIAWAKEIEDWENTDFDCKSLELMGKVSRSPIYSIWWQLADTHPTWMRECELMVKILCKSTILKDDDFRLKRLPLGARMCVRCQLGAREDAAHMIMQCPANHVNRESMGTCIAQICPEIDHGEFFGVLLGNLIDGWSFDDMEPIWRISSRHIYNMYWDTLKARTGVG